MDLNRQSAKQFFASIVLGEMVGTASCEETGKTGPILYKQPKLQQKFQRPQVEGYVVSGKSPSALDASGGKKAE